VLQRDFKKINWKISFLYIFLAFPLVDYILRNLIVIPVISSLWDEIVFAVLLIYVFASFLSTGKKLPNFKLPLGLFVLLGIAHIFIDLPNIKATIDGFRAVYQYILSFFFGYYLIETKKEGVNYLRFLTLIGFLAALVAIIQIIIGVETPAKWVDASEQGLLRAFSFVVHPNVLGSYMLLTTTISFGLIFYEEKKSWKFGWGIITLFSLVALVFSGSRGAWLAIIMAVGVIFLLLNLKYLIVLVIGSIISFTAIPLVRNRFAHLFSADYLAKSANDGRIKRWINAFNNLVQEPFFGKGIGHYGGAVGARHFGTIYVDSYYFKTIAELGLIGITLFLWVVWAVSKELFIIWQKLKGTKEYLLIGSLFAGILGVILHNGVENIFEVPFMNSYFWFLIGLIYIFQKSDQEEN